MNTTQISPLATAMSNLAYTQNGALAHSTSGSKLVDFFAQGGAMRSASEEKIINLFKDAFSENQELALKCLFYLRDVRGGQGERRTFRVIFRWLADNEREIALRFLSAIQEYGRFDDIWELAGTKLENQAFEFIRQTLLQDIENIGTDKPISLAGKWAYSLNASNKARKAIAAKFIKFAGITPKQHRQMLSMLREEINIVERLMCDNKWDDVEFDKIPSRASLIYRKAFSRHTPDKYVSFLESVKKGEKKINVGTLYPYDVITPLFGPMAKIGSLYYGSTKTNVDTDALDVMWNNLPNYLGDKPYNALVVADTSGSMTMFNNALPLRVATSLAIYFAERNNGPFKGHFISFSQNPQMHKVQGNNIAEKVTNLVKTEWGGNTNLQRVFDLVLARAQQEKVSEAGMPKSIIIVSDMQFDTAIPSNTKTNFEAIREKYAASGYVMPELVFWNVNAQGGTSPVKVADANTKLVSGCSPSIFTQLMSGISKTPYELLVETVNTERYARISLS